MWLRIADARAGVETHPISRAEFFEGQPVVEVFVLMDIAVLISVEGFGAASSSAARWMARIARAHTIELRKIRRLWETRMLPTGQILPNDENIAEHVRARIVWTRFSDSGRLAHGIGLTGFAG